MAFALHRLGQVSLPTVDVDEAERFYEEILGLRKLYRFGDLLFFDCGGVRLLIGKSEDGALPTNPSVLYFHVPDISHAVRELKGRGVTFVDEPHLVANMEDHDLWMTFFKDPAGNTLALMQEAPKGYIPLDDATDRSS